MQYKYGKSLVLNALLRVSHQTLLELWKYGLMTTRITTMLVILLLEILILATSPNGKLILGRMEQNVQVHSS